MSLIFASERWKFHVDTKNIKKIFQEGYGFFYNLIWIGNGRFSLLLRGYEFLVNLLSSSSKIWNLIENNFF